MIQLENKHDTKDAMQVYYVAILILIEVNTIEDCRTEVPGEMMRRI